MESTWWRWPKRDAEVDHVDAGGRLFELHGDMPPSCFLAAQAA